MLFKYHRWPMHGIGVAVGVGVGVAVGVGVGVAVGVGVGDPPGVGVGAGVGVGVAVGVGVGTGVGVTVGLPAIGVAVGLLTTGVAVGRGVGVLVAPGTGVLVGTGVFVGATGVAVACVTGVKVGVGRSLLPTVRLLFTEVAGISSIPETSCTLSKVKLDIPWEIPWKVTDRMSPSPLTGSEVSWTKA